MTEQNSQDPRDRPSEEDEERKEHPEGAGSEADGPKVPFEPDDDTPAGDTDQHSDA
jgi:hypothetical protein